MFIVVIIIDSINIGVSIISSSLFMGSNVVDL